MGKRLDTQLSEEDRLALEQVVRKSPDWRSRERAQTLLLLSQPLLSRKRGLKALVVRAELARQDASIWNTVDTPLSGQG